MDRVKPAANRRPVIPAVVLAILLAGCGGADEAAPGVSPGVSPTGGPTAPTTSPAPGASTPPGTGETRVLGTIADGLEVPWGIDFLPDRSALVTERDSGRVLRVTGSGEVTEVGRIDETRAEGEAGLLGLAVSPSYAENRRVFVYTSTDRDNRVLRMTYSSGRLGPPEPIVTGIPRSFIHDGGRLEFGPDGYLYISTGEVGRPDLAADRSTTAGKILRVTEDGDPAPGNPEPASPIWSLGHRNVQGLAFDGAGNLWASEFGQNAWDELNLIVKDGNYGWPSIEGKATTGDPEGFRDPQVVWETSEASPSGLAFAGGALWLASLRGERLWRIEVDGRRASDPVDFFVGDYGRMRTVVTAPGGNLWVTTSNRDGRGDPRGGDDRILLVAAGGAPGS